MNSILLKFITLGHILVILFIIGAPITNSNYFLLLHSLFIPFLILHWVCEDNTCILTIMEKKFKKALLGEYDEDKCVTCTAIYPVYNFRKNNKSYSSLLYFVVLGLWGVSSTKLLCKYKNGQINNFRQLFII